MNDLDRPVRSIRSTKDKQFCFEKKPHLQKKYNKRLRTIIIMKRRDVKHNTRVLKDDEFPENYVVNDSISKETVEDEWIILDVNEKTSTSWYRRFLNFFSWRNDDSRNAVESRTTQ